MKTKGTAIALMLVAILGCTVFAAGTHGEADDISFTWNGKPIEPSYRTLASMGFDRDQILIYLDNLAILADTAKAYAFTGDLDKDGKLYLKKAGQKQLVGLVSHEVYEDGEDRCVDPFADLQAADMRHVRGICLDQAPSRRALELLGQLDTANVFFRITQEAGAGNPKRFPAIPKTALFLDVRETSSDGIQDYSHLKSLKSLVYLRLDCMGGVTTDARVLAGNQDLAWLDLSMQKIANVNALGRLSKLRTLDLSWCEEIAESRFIAGLSELRDLRIPRTGIKDLTPLGELKNIVKVNANLSPVERLPKGPVASLRELNLVATQLTEEQVAAFKKVNPQCQVRHGWTETLRAALKGVDRIRVRSGGTCHRNPKEEKTLFEIKNAKEVNEAIANIVLVPSESGFHCMCCGSPSFEFYSRNKLVATLGFHHGQSLRWMEGEWPGDGLLSEKSGDFLCELLARYGIGDPLEERNEEKLREKAAEARVAVYRKILPAEVGERLSEARSGKDAVKAFVDGVTNKEERVALALRIIGSHNGSWNQRTILDPLAIALLKNEVPSDMLPGSSSPADLEEVEKITASDIVNAFNANKKDSMVVTGTARWFFGERKYASIPKEAISTLLPPVVDAGMTHPRQVNRRRTLYALEEIPDPTATAELRKILAGSFKAESLKPGEEIEPGGMVEYIGRDGDIGDKCSDQALAALILAKRDDKESLIKIQALLKAEKEPDSKKVLKKAVGILKKAR